MKTAEKNAKGVQGTTAQAKKATDVRTENRPNITGKEAKEDKKDETVNEAKTGNPATVDNQPAHIAEQPKAGEVKEEIRYIKPTPNLEQTLKAVDTLHRWTILRTNLIARIKQLEAFEVALRQENDELEDNPFQGCKLIIKDDKNREFVTTTPGLIRLVSKFIFNACGEKLAEIEANIVFPNA